MNSTRLPGKVMKSVGGLPLIELLLKRLSQSETIDDIIVATSSDEENKPLIDHITSLKIACEIGSEDNVLERFVIVGEKYNADIIVRITGDCPLIDPYLVDQCVNGFKANKVDYFTNVDPPIYPDGMDVEVITLKALQESIKQTDDKHHKEHVTSFIRESELFKKDSISKDFDYSKLRLTVDNREDLTVVNNIANYFIPDWQFDWKQILQLYELKPHLFDANKNIKRNEGLAMGAGQKLWVRAKNIIPGGNMLLSKRPEMFFPNKWPAYYSKSKGCKVWDLDNTEYIDMSIMGIGTNILGYGNSEVDEAVTNAIKKGNMSTLNCPEEVVLAEALVELHPWSEMVRLARTGGEANAIAVRIGRATSARDKVAICGYHGWHDWYLSANLGDNDKLDGHLLPGLEPKGVPRNLKDTVFTFRYNRIDELIKLVNEHDIGVIKMEVARNEQPKENFLMEVRQIANKHGIVLIFDECTSGFRQTNGGLHKLYGVEPDMAIFGKALGNGYAITAIIGRKEVMESAQSTFISSTFWTERIGPSAAIKTLEVMRKMKSWEIITKIGEEIKKGWSEIANNHNVKINQWGIPALAGFTFEHNNPLMLKTLVTQEMLKYGYLASNSVYVSTEHTQNILDEYFEKIDKIFELIKSMDDEDINNLLESEICHSGFRRVN